MRLILQMLKNAFRVTACSAFWRWFYHFHFSAVTSQTHQTVPHSCQTQNEYVRFLLSPLATDNQSVYI